MVQIKLTVAFVLAAAAIAPVVALPIHEDREFDGHVSHRRHLHRHPVASPEELSNESELNFDAPIPFRREYEDEFEARGLLFGQGGNLNLLSSFENQDRTEMQDAQLWQQHQSLERENRHLEHKKHRLEREDKHLEHKKHTLEREDKSLLNKKHRLERQDKNLEHKHKSLKAQDKFLEAKHDSLEHQNKVLTKKDKKLAAKGKALAHKDKALEHKGKVLEHHNKVLKKEGKVLAHEDKVLARKGKALEHHDKVLEQKGNHGHKEVVHSELDIVAREYLDSDEIFEREVESVESSAKTISEPHSKSPSHFRHEPVISPGLYGPHYGHGPAAPPRLRFGGPHSGLVIPPGMHFGHNFRYYGGHGPVVHPHRKPGTPLNLHFGPGPVRLHHGPARPRQGVEVIAREFTDSDEVFEREFEDVEFDARDIDEEFYLD